MILAALISLAVHPSAQDKTVFRSGVQTVALHVTVRGADGRLVGYGGGLDRKAWLLRHEGVFV